MKGTVQMLLYLLLSVACSVALRVSDIITTYVIPDVAIVCSECTL